MNPKSNHNHNGRNNDSGNSSRNNKNLNNPSGGNPGEKKDEPLHQSPESILASVPKERLYFEIPFVASLLDCSRRHVFRLIDAGKLRNCVDISSHDSSRKLLRIPRSSIEAYLKDNNF